MWKAILKIIGGILAGIIFGLLIAGLLLVYIKGMTWHEYFYGKLFDSLMVAIVTCVAFILAIVILVPLHEFGHLVFGLMTGYKFVSFRIFDRTLVRIDDKFKIKRFSVGGTLGQCLMSPPEKPLERIPTVWYNFGGVAMNLIALLLVLPVLFVAVNPLVKVAAFMFILADALLILMNGLPLKISGTGNDGYNMLHMRRNLVSKRGFVEALRANALIQAGVRPKDMPDEWFRLPDNIDYSDQLQVGIPMMVASRKIDEKRYEEALQEFENLYTNKEKIIPLYVKEIECELVFLRLIAGRTDDAKLLLDKDLRKYIDIAKSTMSSKQRVLCAIYLYLDKDPDKAQKIYEELNANKEEYLLRGEVESDLALMEDMLHTYNSGGEPK